MPADTGISAEELVDNSRFEHVRCNLAARTLVRESRYKRRMYLPVEDWPFTCIEENGLVVQDDVSQPALYCEPKT